MAKPQLTIFLNEHLGYFQCFFIIVNNVFIECIYLGISVDFWISGCVHLNFVQDSLKYPLKLWRSGELEESGQRYKIPGIR